MENTIIDYSWQAGAACSVLSPDLFYLKQGKTVSQTVIDACTSCPVKEECLSHALKYEVYGYWALTTPSQRAIMRKELGIEIIHIEYESTMKVLEEITKHEDFVNRQKIKGRGRKPAACGTRAGYNAHLRRKKTNKSEVPCDACKRAHTDAMINYKNSKKDMSEA